MNGLRSPLVSGIMAVVWAGVAIAPLVTEWRPDTWLIVYMASWHALAAFGRALGEP